MRFTICLRVQGERAATVLEAARAVEGEGFGGIAMSDELMDIDLGGTWSHDPWTLLSSVAAVTSEVHLMPFVLNVANRDAGTTAVAAATLQDVSGGRLWLGLGSGTNAGEQFSRDQDAFGRTPAPAKERRIAARRHIREMRRIWAAEHFLQPEPEIPIVFGAFGPIGAKLAGQHADAIAAPLDGFGGPDAPRLEDVARLAQEARREAGRPGRVRVVAHTGPFDDASDPLWRRGSPAYDRLLALGVEHLVLFLAPDVAQVRAAARHLPLELGA
ncbi:LLM class flavin-dependent oxidoreductase [Agrococcus citreus]|uniref:Luciferase-like domain-containing protein n=1 Tax=Agrococcus citreus TaxID=84643 RepID=A0ABP4JP74_9MICO